MAKFVEEDWTFFNTAVRERAESKPPSEAPTLKVVTPDPFPMPPSTRSEQGTVPASENISFPPNIGYRPSIVQPSIGSELDYAKTPNASIAPSSLNQRTPAQPPPEDPAVQAPKSLHNVTNPTNFADTSSNWLSSSGQQPRDAKLPSSVVAPPASRYKARHLNDDGVIRIVTWSLILFALTSLLVLALMPWKNVDWSRPLIPLGQSDAMQTARSSTEAVVTDYTTFNRVAFRNWSVVTGWNFARNGDTSPTAQYCYLEVATSVGRQSYNIESRPARVREQRPDVLIPGLDDTGWQDAATRCQWHS